MNPRLARLLVRLYPRAWRERYGAEFEGVLQDGGSRIRASVNVIWSALCERVIPTTGLTMSQYPISVITLTKKPSAFLPIVMSLTALSTIGAAAVYGFVTGHGGLVREPDEGAIAHLWQLLMAGQLPILAFFAIKWLPRAPRQTLYVLAMQAGAVLASMAPVFFLKL